MKHIKRDFGSKTCARPVYQIKGNHGCSNMVENILAGNPLSPPLTLGVKRLKLNFYRILSYQTNPSLEFRNMAANILPTYLLPTHSTLGVGLKVKIELIDNMVLLLMKLNRIAKAATCKYFGHKSPLPTPLTLWSKVNLFRTWSCCISN